MIGMTRYPAVAIAVAVGLTGHHADPRQDPADVDTSERAVVRAASAYVETYRRDVAYLLADETTTQTRRRGDAEVVDARRLQGELFLTYLDADRAWIAVHDVATVDGVPVPTPDRDDLMRLLAGSDAFAGIARRVADRNARFNLGSVARNFNEPTLPLMLLNADRVGAVSFDRAAVTRDDSSTLVALKYREDDRGTLVRSPTRPLRASGELLVEAGTGRVRRTTFSVRQGSLRADLVTTYAFDERLNLWLPATFTERYEGEVDDAKEVIECETTYSNYRRFTVRARIKR
jgi:hypothetical protein